MSRVRSTLESYLRGAIDTTVNSTLYPILATDSGALTQYNISKSKLYYNPSTGQLNATKVIGAVYNDIADFIEVPEGFTFEYGKVYIRNKDFQVEESSLYLQKGIVGIASDTFGFAVGEKEEFNQIPIAVGGWVLAYVDKIYEPGTPLTSTENGYLTEIKLEDKSIFPERIIAVYDRPEKLDEWNGIEVRSRSWVKVK